MSNQSCRGAAIWRARTSFTAICNRSSPPISIRCSIVASWRDPIIWLELIDRYLIAAERNHLEAIICVNKIDLAEDEDACRAEMRPYEDAGYHLIFTSAVAGEGIAALREMLRGQTTALAGMSGVGKSSLLTACNRDSDFGQER